MDAKTMPELGQVASCAVSATAGTRIDGGDRDGWMAGACCWALIDKAPGATGGVRSGAAAQLLGVCISALFPSGRPWPCLARALVSSSSLMIKR